MWPRPYRQFIFVINTAERTWQCYLFFFFFSLNIASKLTLFWGSILILIEDWQTHSRKFVSVTERKRVWSLGAGLNEQVDVCMKSNKTKDKNCSICSLFLPAYWLAQWVDFITCWMWFVRCCVLVVLRCFLPVHGFKVVPEKQDNLFNLSLSHTHPIL